MKLELLEDARKDQKIDLHTYTNKSKLALFEKMGYIHITSVFQKFRIKKKPHRGQVWFVILFL